MTNERDGRATKDDGAEAAGTEETVDSLKAQLEEERNRAQGYFQSWQRAAADFQNYKRRTDEDKQRNAMFANVALVMNLLPAVDDLERALNSIDQNTEGFQWVDGIRQILRKFQGALEASNVKEVPAEGQDFDPNVHEAVAQAEGEQGKVIKVLQRGYTMGDRVIRPAMVIVGSGQ
jgi:molecular chaperone GrpE